MSKRCNQSSYYGGDSRSSSKDEYLERTHVVDDFLRVPQVHNKKPEKHEHRQIEILHANVYHPAPEIHRKVHFTDKEKIVGTQRKVKHDAKTIDIDADGFIQQQHKTFESYNTLRGY